MCSATSGGDNCSVLTSPDEHPEQASEGDGVPQCGGRPPDLCRSLPLSPQGTLRETGWVERIGEESSQPLLGF